MHESYHLQEEGMDVLVMLEDNPDHSPVLAHVNSVPSPLSSAERPSRDIVTLYGAPSPESLALALAAAVECHRSSENSMEAIRHLGVWPERGAIGDAAWRDVSTGQLMTRDLEIPLEILHSTAGRLLAECGQLIRRSGRWAYRCQIGQREHAARSRFRLGPSLASQRQCSRRSRRMLDRMREAEGLTFEAEGD